METTLLKTIPIKKVYYEEISQKFLSSFRDEITSDRLSLIEKISSEIQVSSKIGEFANQQDYRRALKILNLSTQETRNRKICLLKRILPEIANKRKFLDLGCGSGIVTKIISRYFSETTLVDLDTESLNKNTLRNKKLIKLNSDILTIKLPINEFDLVLLSHTIYYLPKIAWELCLCKIYNSLKKNGLLVIILSGGLDKQKIAEYFKGDLIDTNILINWCEKNLDSHIQILWSLETFIATNENAALSIAGICLNDANTTASPDACLEYLQSHNYSVNRNRYEMNVKQEFIIIRKN